MTEGMLSPVRNICETSNPLQNSHLRRSPRLIEKAAARVVVEGCDVAGDGESCLDGEVGVPVVGMVFRNMLDVEDFYKAYAESVGFGVVRGAGTDRFVDGARERRATTWKCECFGSPDQNYIRKYRKNLKNPVEEEIIDKEMCKPKRRNSKKCGCAALVRAAISPSNEWVIKRVVLEHSGHSPNPSEAKLVKEYRMKKMGPDVKRKLVIDLEAGQTLSKSFSSMVIERGGYHNMPFTEADARHVVHQHRKLKMAGGDCNALFAYFEKMHLENNNFFYTHRVDDAGFIKDIVWVDPRSMAAYEEFSDVVCFDTTYLTNQYSLPFANFVGINHHGQTCLFGCALISHEDAETFEWVFRKWLLAMKGREPGGILTDQAAAMRKPLEDVMPHARHRWCIWHIMVKLPYKLGTHKRYFQLRDEIKDIVYNSLNEGEFVVRWKEMLEKFEVVNNEWLLTLFEERHMWVPAFMNDHFWGGMRSTQRIESIHNFFDQFVNRNTLLCEFGERYVAAVAKRVAQEDEADLKANKYKRHLATGYSLERYFRNLYTIPKFKVFQFECQRVTYCVIDEEKKVDDKMFRYLIQDRVWVLPKAKRNWVIVDRRTYYCVDFDSISREACCSCKMFENHGILCRHLLRVYDKLQIEDLPEKYILRRWRKDVLFGHSSVRLSSEDPLVSALWKRRDRITVATHLLRQTGAVSERCTVIVLDGIARLQEEVNAARADELRQLAEESEAESNGVSKETNPVQDHSDRSDRHTVSPGVLSQTSQIPVEAALGTPCSRNTEAINVKDPPVVKKRGRPKESRFKQCCETGWKCRKNPSDNDGTPDTSEKNGKGKGRAKGSTSKESKKSAAGQGKRKAVVEEIPDNVENGENGQGPKMKVRRGKSVSFVLDRNDSLEYMEPLDDELLDRNGVTYSDLSLC